MTETKEQAVAEGADAQQNSGTEAVGAQAEPTLDEILDKANWNDGQQPARSEPSQQTAQQQDAVLKELESVKSELAKVTSRLADQDFNNEFNSTADRLSEGLDVDPEAFKDALYGRVGRDDRLSNAYKNRDKDPDTWRQIEAALKKEFSGRYPAKEQIDEDTTNAREAVAAAVKGQSSTAQRSNEPTDAEIAAMSDKEFNDYQRKKGAPMFS